jgi:chromosome partitioning protein
MKVVLCTNHKGGVGKTELAIHVAGIFRQELSKTLLIDCDGQADAWKFYFGADPTEGEEGQRRRYDDYITVIWQPRKKQQVGTREALSKEFDSIVIDVDAALEDTVQTLTQSYPDLVLIPVRKQHDALVNLANPLAVVVQLEKKLGITPVVRIVPIGLDQSWVQAIRERIASLPELPRQCQIMPRIRDLENKANLARKRRKYIWEFASCDDLESYYRKLTVT